MKHLSVLLIAAAVTLSAAAGTSTARPIKMVNSQQSKTMMPSGDLTHNKRIGRNSTQSLDATSQLRTMSWKARPASQALKSENTILWDFEDPAQLEDWAVIDADGDGHNWLYGNEEGLVTHSGTGAMASESFDNATMSALTPDNWLVSPIVSLQGSLVFYAVGQDPSFSRETFAVYAAVGEPESIEDFVKISDDYTTTSTMKEIIVDLSQFEGQEGCIAIRHYNSTDQFLLVVDDVTITTDEVIPEPEPETPEVITEIPEGCVVKTYYRDSGTILYHWLIGIYARPTAGKFAIAFDPESNDVYIQDPIWAYENLNVWIKGTIDPQTNLITIPTGQYLYWDTEFEYGLKLVWGSSYVYEQGTDPDTGEPAYMMGSEVDERTTEFYMQLDGDNVYLLDTFGDIYAEFPMWGDCMGMMLIWSDTQNWDAFEFANHYQDGSDRPFGTLAVIVPAVPANPTADEFVDGGNEIGSTRFYFTLPETDVDGNKIDFELLSYSVWVENDNGPEIFTFKADEYIYDLTEDMTEIPYEIFYGGYDFYDYLVYLYRTNAPGYEPLFTKNIGIQAHYTVDGIKNSSEIAWLYDRPVSVNEMNAGKTVANVRYYNVAGQQVAQPNGMTIQVTTFTDGTTSVAKVVK